METFGFGPAADVAHGYGGSLDFMKWLVRCGRENATLESKYGAVFKPHIRPERGSAASGYWRLLWYFALCFGYHVERTTGWDS